MPRNVQYRVIDNAMETKMTTQELEREKSRAYAEIAVKGLDPAEFAKAWEQAKQKLISLKMACQQ